MWTIFFIAAGFFVAILAMGYFAVQQGEEQREVALAGAPTEIGSCSICEAPHRARVATSDEIVFEVEHRIDTELRDISHALHGHPERLDRLFHA